MPRELITRNLGISSTTPGTDMTAMSIAKTTWAATELLVARQRVAYQRAEEHPAERHEDGDHERVERPARKSDALNNVTYACVVQLADHSAQEAVGGFGVGFERRVRHLHHEREDVGQRQQQQDAEVHHPAVQPTCSPAVAALLVFAMSDTRLGRRTRGVQPDELVGSAVGGVRVGSGRHRRGSPAAAA